MQIERHHVWRFLILVYLPIMTGLVVYGIYRLFKFIFAGE